MTGPSRPNDPGRRPTGRRPAADGRARPAQGQARRSASGAGEGSHPRRQQQQRKGQREGQGQRQRSERSPSRSSSGQRARQRRQAAQRAGARQVPVAGARQSAARRTPGPDRRAEPPGRQRARPAGGRPGASRPVARRVPAQGRTTSSSSSRANGRATARTSARTGSTARMASTARSAAAARPAQAGALARAVRRQRARHKVRLEARREKPPVDPRRRAVVLLMVLALLMGVVGVQLLRLQVISADRYVSYGEDQRLRGIELVGGRGQILDRDEQVLVLDAPRRTVVADPRAVVDPAQTARDLARLLDVAPSVLYNRLDAGEEAAFAYVARQVEEDVAETVDAAELSGVWTIDEPVRLQAAGAESVLGSTDPDGRGIAGLERAYNSTLAGSNGRMVVERDKEGFLRSETSLFQIVGRAARNVKGKAILYADKMTRSIVKVVEETNRRREIQMAYNREHGIVPTTIVKDVKPLVDPSLISTRGFDLDEEEPVQDALEVVTVEEERIHYRANPAMKEVTFDSKEKFLEYLRESMMQAARQMEFEEAARIRDQIANIEKEL